MFDHAVNAVGKLNDILWWVVWIGRVGLMVGSIMVRSHGSSRDHALGWVEGKGC